MSYFKSSWITFPRIPNKYTSEANLASDVYLFGILGKVIQLD